MIFLRLSENSIWRNNSSHFTLQLKFSALQHRHFSHLVFNDENFAWRSKTLFFVLAFHRVKTKINKKNFPQQRSSRVCFHHKIFFSSFCKFYNKLLKTSSLVLNFYVCSNILRGPLNYRYFCHGKVFMLCLTTQFCLKLFRTKKINVF